MRLVYHKRAENSIWSVPGTRIELSEDEKKLLSQHGGDLAKSGLLLDYLRLMQKAADAKKKKPFFERVSEIRAECREKIMGFGFPDPDAEVAFRDDDWRYFSRGWPLSRLKEGEKATKGFSFIKRATDRKPLSMPSLLLRILHLCDRVREEEDLERKCELSGLLAHTCLQAQIVECVEPITATGKTMRDALDGHRAEANRKARAKMMERRAIIAELLPATRRTGGALEEYLLRILSEKHGIDVTGRTIRNDLDEIVGKAR